MAEEKLIIEGLRPGQRITGSVSVNGSKNDAVQAIAAALLFRNGLTLKNLPAIADVEKMLALISNLGCQVVQEKNQAIINAPLSMARTVLDSEIAEKIRASILLTGPLLARYGSVTFPHPGGCVIGERPIDLFLEGFKKMGAAVTERDGTYQVAAPPTGLRAARIFFRQQSVTATETFLMTAVLARGKTILENCALEPEIASLGHFLKHSGAKIDGLGTPTIAIYGRGALNAVRPRYGILPDRIEAGSFVILGALVGDNFKITNLCSEHLGALLALLEVAGVAIQTTKSSVTVSRPARLRPLQVKTHEYPGFATDLQAPLAVFLTQSDGLSSIFETIFEGRLGYVSTLTLMGARLKIVNSQRLEIQGPTPLVGRAVSSPDLRAGLAYIFAGLIAKGQTVVHNVHYIDRGYERLDERLRALGFNVKRR